jgi:membrane protein YdbS with pleckstrin-like domain
MTKPSPEEEAQMKRTVLTARIGLVVAIVAASVTMALVPDLRGFLKYVVIVGVATLATSGSIAEQIRYRAWQNKMRKR